MALFTFCFTLLLSVAGNVVATWGHPQEAVIGGLFPVFLLLAERMQSEASKLDSKMKGAITAAAALIALCCMVWSASHLASLVSGTWMRWLIPVAVDALMLVAGAILMAQSPKTAEPSPAHPEVIPEPIPEVIPKVAEDGPRDIPPAIPELSPAPSRDASPRPSRKPSSKPRKAPVRMPRSEDEDVLAVRAEAAVQGTERLGVTKVKKLLNVGDAYAKKVIDLAFATSDATH